MAEKVKKPIYKKWWFYLIIGLVVVGVIGAIAGATSSESKQSDDSIPNVSENVSDDTSSDKKQDKINYYTVDDTINVGNFSYTVNAVINSKFFIAADKTIKTEKNFLILNVTITNLGSKTELINAYNLYVVKEAVKYEVSYHSEDLSPYYSLGAGLSKTFNIIFEVPNKSSDAEYHLQIKELKEIADVRLQEKSINDEKI